MMSIGDRSVPRRKTRYLIWLWEVTYPIRTVKPKESHFKGVSWTQRRPRPAPDHRAGAEEKGECSWTQMSRKDVRHATVHTVQYLSDAERERAGHSRDEAVTSP
jgi:hypothetical protein